MLLFSLPALGLVLTSKQTRKALMNGDRQLAECSKGRQAPDPLWASVSPFVNEGKDLVISKDPPGSDGVDEMILFFLTHV